MGDFTHIYMILQISAVFHFVLDIGRLGNVSCLVS